MITARAALLYGPGQDYVIDTVELDEPGPGEVLIEMRACGLCRSDEHVRTGNLPLPNYPVINGHEGAGEVLEVGEGVTSVTPGDHVAMSYIPSCGSCGPCRVGRGFLCDEGARLFDIGMITDGRVAHRVNDQPVARFSQLGAFADRQVLAESSVVKVDSDIPWPAVALVSCGVATGFGSAVNRAGVRPGDTVAVLGVGGVGISAIQGARVAGARRIIAVDPVEFKREQALRFGATHVFDSLDEAIAGVGALTWGQMCDSVICTFGVMRGELLEPALTLTAKGGTCVVTAVAPPDQKQADVNLFVLAMENKEIKGCLYGSESPRTQIPRLLNMYRDGILKLDELITKTYTLDQVNQGYADMEAGRILRGVITF
ncbi:MULTISPECIES: NDMA-dependent alcohol dehydrogenase [unclassified Nocardia]|uniref:NDMA-dependent alcohol dehydrogenase n=1 Tax=unclassified Nocardia TaxID=2637762 RepID=UPI001CE47170|nr:MULTISPECIES: NDMA-dependent alcohol dehydrogenase [unclassified Nocardia]